MNYPPSSVTVFNIAFVNEVINENSECFFMAGE
jgi:hypothetical protein